MKKIGFLLVAWSIQSLAQTGKLVCKHYVVNDIEFCTVTLTVLQDGSLKSPAQINHQGSVQPSVLIEKPTQEGQLYRLYLDADKPGKEIEMVVQETKNQEGQYPAVLINHEAPFAKEMYGTCLESN